MLCVTLLRPFIYPPKMGIVKARKMGRRSKIFSFSKTVQDYGIRSADICLVMQPVGQAGHSLSMCMIRSLRLKEVNICWTRTQVVSTVPRRPFYALCYWACLKIRHFFRSNREFSNERTRVERRETFRKLRMRENFSKAFEGYFQWIIRAGNVPPHPPPIEAPPHPFPFASTVEIAS